MYLLRQIAITSSKQIIASLFFRINKSEDLFNALQLFISAWLHPEVKMAEFKLRLQVTQKVGSLKKSIYCQISIWS